MQYELSSEMEKIARRVINRYHPDLSSKDIKYVMLSKFDKEGQLIEKRSKNGHIVMAEVETITGTKAFLISGSSRTDENGPAGYFAVKVYRYTWNLLDENEREALIDEQLCQLNYNDETGAPSKGEYDALMFASNVKRFGLWNERIERVLNAIKEPPLIVEIEKAESSVKVVKANGKATPPVFTIHPDKQCSQCGGPDATDDGRCMNCGGGKEAITEALTNNLPPIQQQVNQKRGRGKAARV